MCAPVALTLMDELYHKCERNITSMKTIMAYIFNLDSVHKCYAQQEMTRVLEKTKKQNHKSVSQTSKRCGKLYKINAK